MSTRAFRTAEARSLREPDPPLEQCPTPGADCYWCSLRHECPEPDTMAECDREQKEVL